MPEVQIDNHFKRGTTDRLIRSHNCSVTNTESFAIAPQRIRSHLLLLRSEYGDYFDTESSNCANSPLCNAVSIQSCQALTVTLGLPTGMQKDTQIQRWKRDEQTAWTEVYLKTLVTSAPTGGHAAEVGLPAGGTDQWEGCWEGGRVILVFVSNLFKLQHTFVQILKSYCLYWKIYLSELQNVFSQFKNGFVKITARWERLNSWWLNYMPWGPILTVKIDSPRFFHPQGTHRISPFSWGTK